jgi:hypothetical protein
MTYDDSEKALARGAAAARTFKCLLCNRAMWDTGERWECRCGFFYKPLVPGTIPKKYQHGAVSATTLCRDCRKLAVKGIRRYCERCALKRKLASTRRSKRAKQGRNGRKTENSPIGAEALTKAKMSDRCNDPQKRSWPSFSSARQGTQRPVSAGPEGRKTKEVATS